MCVDTQPATAYLLNACTVVISGLAGWTPIHRHLPTCALARVCLQVHASAAKAAVDSITRSLALEWGEYNIRVAGVAPGPIQGTAGGWGPGVRQAGLPGVGKRGWKQEPELWQVVDAQAACCSTGCVQLAEKQ
jgi:NAD(P)-dependent dehydrogenase (short-subunit alcohol dehydrogenase family)